MQIDQIKEAKQKELKILKETKRFVDLKAKARSAFPLRDLKGSLEGKTPAIILEIKKYDPFTKKSCEVNLDVLKHPAVNAFCVPTDKEFYNGSFDNLKQVKLSSPLPLIRRDFVLDEYQIYESRVMLADGLFLNACLLEKSQLFDYVEICRELTMLPVIEINDQRELEIAIELKQVYLAINNYDQHGPSLSKTLLLQPVIKEFKIVSEYGITSKDDVNLLKKAGITACLIDSSDIKLLE